MRLLWIFCLMLFGFSKSEKHINNNTTQVKMISTTTSKSGSQKQTYRHYYNGIPVAFSDYHKITHKGKANTYGRKYDIDTTFNSNQQIPLKNLLERLGDDYLPMQDNLVVLDVSFQNKAYALTYQLFNKKNDSLYFVNANSGKTELTLPTQYGCTSTLCSGNSNNYGVLQFNACQTQNQYQLKNEDKDIHLWNADSLSYLSAPPPLNPITSNSPVFTNVAAINTYHSIEQTYNYFENTFQYAGLDGDHFPITAWLLGNDNFYYDKMYKAALIGVNGNITVDIVAHEIVHGINDLTAGLIYLGEPGALSESFSDIFGELVENYVFDTNDWLVNSDIYNVNNAIRDFVAPANFFQPDTFLIDQYWYDGFADCGGVHINSGVHNHWFYLLAVGGKNVTGIGLDKAAAIAFKNLTYYLFPTAHFIDAKIGSLQAAEDLFGANSFEVNQVENAWKAVGVFNNTELDSLVLVDLYQQANGDNWFFSWDLTKPMDFWHGVVLDNNRRVIGLDLSFNNLTNYLSFKIGNLSELIYLDVSDNPTTRTLIFELGNLKELTYLDLSNSNNSLGYYNNCSDDYYLSVLAELPKLAYLDISDNYFIGCYPYQMRMLSQQLPFLGNSQISRGNYFDESWNNFINYNIGYCNNCVDNLELNNLVEFEFIPQVQNAIETNGNLTLNNTNTQTEIYAGNKVILNAGFEVTKDSNLLIGINSCTIN